MKKMLSLLTVAFLVSKGLGANTNEFSYKYEVIAASNKTSDILAIYNVKEKLIDTYESLIFDVAESYHEQTLKDNISKFNVCETCQAKYENNKIVVYIGNGAGKRVAGSLKRNSCDDKPTRVQFFFSRFFK